MQLIADDEKVITCSASVKNMPRLDSDNTYFTLKMSIFQPKMASDGSRTYTRPCQIYPEKANLKVVRALRTNGSRPRALSWTENGSFMTLFSPQLRVIDSCWETWDY